MSTDALAGAVGALVTVTAALGIALARTRERVAKLEEWARLRERELGEEFRSRSGSRR